MAKRFWNPKTKKYIPSGVKLAENYFSSTPKTESEWISIFMEKIDIKEIEQVFNEGKKIDAGFLNGKKCYEYMPLLYSEFVKFFHELRIEHLIYHPVWNDVYKTNFIPNFNIYVLHTKKEWEEYFYRVNFFHKERFGMLFQIMITAVVVKKNSQLPGFEWANEAERIHFAITKGDDIAFDLFLQKKKSKGLLLD